MKYDELRKSALEYSLPGFLATLFPLHSGKRKWKTYIGNDKVIWHLFNSPPCRLKLIAAFKSLTESSIALVGGLGSLYNLLIDGDVKLVASELPYLIASAVIFFDSTQHASSLG